jgi:hypothetical protein
MSDFINTKYGHSKIYQSTIREAHNNSQDSLLEQVFSPILGNEYKADDRQEVNKERAQQSMMNQSTLSAHRPSRNHHPQMQGMESKDQRTTLEEEFDREMDEDVSRLLKNEIEENTENDPYYMQRSNRLFEAHMKIATDESLRRIEAAFNEELQREQNFFLSCRTDTGKSLLNPPRHSHLNRGEPGEVETSVNRFKNIILVRKSRRQNPVVPSPLIKLEKIDEERPKSILKKRQDRLEDTLPGNAGSNLYDVQASGKLTTSEYLLNKSGAGVYKPPLVPNISTITQSRHPKVGHANYSSMGELSRVNLLPPSPIPASHPGKESLQNNLNLASKHKSRNKPLGSRELTPHLKDISSKFNQENYPSRILGNESRETDPKESRIMEDLQHLDRNLKHLPPIENYRSMFTSNSIQTVQHMPAVKGNAVETKTPPSETMDKEHRKTVHLEPHRFEEGSKVLRKPITGYCDLHRLKKLPRSVSISKPLKVNKELQVIASSPQGRIKMKVNFDLRRLIDDS